MGLLPPFFLGPRTFPACHPPLAPGTPAFVAHRPPMMIALGRTGTDETSRHGGLSQLRIDLASPGITIRPIVDLAGDTHFNEVFFDDVLVPDGNLIGSEGAGWKQVTSELSLE